MIVQMTIREFADILPRICGKDTSIDPKGWRKNNPFWGHSAVVALLAQSLFGGKIYGVDFRGTKFFKMKFHLWNNFPDGKIKDFTRSQFGKNYPGELEIKQVGAANLLAERGMSRRFKLLQEKFEAECKEK